MAIQAARTRSYTTSLSGGEVDVGVIADLVDSVLQQRGRAGEARSNGLSVRLEHDRRISIASRSSEA